MGRALLAVLLAAALAGCGLLGGAGAETPEETHVVFLTEPGCAWIVVQSRGERFSVLAPTTDFAPRRGDVLLGDLRPGALPLRVVPFPGHQVAGALAVEVAGVRLSLPEAQTLWRGRCAEAARTL